MFRIELCSEQEFQKFRPQILLNFCRFLFALSSLLGFALASDSSHESQIAALGVRTSRVGTGIEVFQASSLLDDAERQTQAFLKDKDLRSADLTMRSNRSLISKKVLDRSDFKKIFWLLAAGNGFDLLVIDPSLANGRWAFIYGESENPEIVATAVNAKPELSRAVAGVLKNRGYQALLLPGSDPTLSLISPFSQIAGGTLGVAFSHSKKGSREALALVEIIGSKNGSYEARLLSRDKGSWNPTQPTPVAFEVQQLN